MFPALILSPSRPPPSLLLWLRAELFLVINKTLPATFQPVLTDQRVVQFVAERNYFWLQIAIVSLAERTLSRPRADDLAKHLFPLSRRT